MRNLPRHPGAGGTPRRTRRTASTLIGTVLTAALAVTGLTAATATPAASADTTASAATGTTTGTTTGTAAGTASGTGKTATAASAQKASRPSGTDRHTTSAPGSKAPKTTGKVTSACATPKKGQARCLAKRVAGTAAGTGVQALASAPSGYGPSDLLSAYDLPAGGGAGATIAIVDAYDDPTAEADLAVYREQFGLPPLREGQFKKVNQRGEESDYPTPDAGWSTEIALDLDMVSAIAPEADILLVEADGANLGDLGASVDEAVALGATYVSNSYGQSESADDASTAAAHYSHPGVAVVASSGDDAYGVSFPASAPDVTAVGGTSLTEDDSDRGWSEKAWSGAGSGCSAVQAKPAFQYDAGCGTRSVADVSAVASPYTGVAVYATYGDNDGWAQYGGTSVSSPIIASVYALAGQLAKDADPRTFPYKNSAQLNDVTEGTNGTCDESAAYLCTAQTGYDGPTGLGTPAGLGAFVDARTGTVSGKVTDSSGNPVSGADIAVTGSSMSTTVRTGADGTYKIALSVGDYSLAPSYFGHAAASPVSVTVTDGGTAQADFQLADLRTVRISGTVADASGHGWGLYSQIKVNDGAQVGPFYTDPYTGEYTLSLPVDTTYTLTFTSQVPGYESLQKKVSVGDDDVRADAGLTAQLLAAHGSAPGYEQSLTTDTDETFAAGTLPTGWKTAYTDGSAEWAFAPKTDSTLTGRATVRQDAGTHTDAATDAALLTTPVAVPAGRTVRLYWAWKHSDGVASVDYTVDGGSTWTSAWSSTGSDATDKEVLLPAADTARRLQVRLRLTVEPGKHGLFQVTQLTVGSAKLTAVPGGLVAGQVTSSAHGTDLDGATVALAGSAKASTTSSALAGREGSGYYYLFSPATGHRKFDVSAPYYTPATLKATVTKDRVTRLDAALDNGVIEAGGDLSATVAPNGSASRELTLTNTGNGAATVHLRQLDATGTTAAAASDGTKVERQSLPAGSDPLKHPLATARAALRAAEKSTAGAGTEKSNQSAGTAKSSATQGTTAAGTWGSIPALPQASLGGVAATYKGTLYAGLGLSEDGLSGALYAYDPKTGEWEAKAQAPRAGYVLGSAFLDGKLYVTSGVNNLRDPLEVYDPATDSWSDAAANPYSSLGATVALGGKLYQVGGLDHFATPTAAVTVYDPSTDSWSRAADYPESITFEQCGAISGRMYCAGGETVNTQHAQVGTRDAFVYDPATDSWHGIASLPITLALGAAGTANGELVLAGGVTGKGGDEVTNQVFAYDPEMDWWAQLPTLAEPTFYAAGASGYYVVGGLHNGAVAADTPVLSGYDSAAAADVDWLSVDRTTVTVPAGKSVKVKVRLDGRAAGLDGPGTVSAALSLDSDALTPVAPVAVTLTAKAPAGWSHLTGTVRTAAGRTPLPGATVQAGSGRNTVSVTTGTDGTYSLWLDTGGDPAVTVTATAPGHRPGTTRVKITNGTGTGDITLTRK